jgi:hypothetical protein
MIEAREREAKAVALRRSGASYRDISAAIGYASPASAHRAVMRALDRLGVDDATALRQLEGEHLLDLRRKLLTVVNRHRPLLYRGRPVRDGNGNPLEDDSVRVNAVTALVRVEERLARLYGLDLTEPAEVHVHAEVEVAGDDRLAQMRNELAERLASLGHLPHPRPDPQPGIAGPPGAAVGGDGFPLATLTPQAPPVPAVAVSIDVDSREVPDPEPDARQAPQAGSRWAARLPLRVRPSTNRYPDDPF